MRLKLETTDGEGLLGILEAYWALVELQVELQAQGRAL